MSGAQYMLTRAYYAHSVLEADIMPIAQVRSQDSEKGSVTCFKYTFQSPASYIPHPWLMPSSSALTVRSSHPYSESPYLQSWGPAPRVRTGVAGTLRPSKLEALLGSERVGLDRDRQAQVRVQVRDHTRQQALLPTQAQDPPPGSLGQGRGSRLPGGAGHRVPPALQIPIKI